MRRLEYVSSRGERHGLDGPSSWLGPAAALRGHRWSYELGWRSASSISRDAREADVDAAFTDPAALDALRDAADADMAAGAPGRLVAGGEWSQRAYVAAFEPDVVYEPSGLVTGSLTVVLLDGAWRRERSLRILPEPDAAGEWLDLPHDWPVDYGAGRPPRAIEVEGPLPAPVRLVVYGPASDPVVRIAGNRYEFHGEVPAGGYLEADGASFPRTVRVVAANGDERDAFAWGERGAGEGSGRYCFQPLPPGRAAVTVDGAFGVDIDWYEERGEPPWS